MNITLRKCDDRATVKKLRRLYNAAFPKDERAPFSLMKRRAKKGKGEMLAAEEGGEFAGLAYLVCFEDLVYLFYLAVEKEKRGRGVGGGILAAIKERYAGKRIFLAREQLDESAENYRQRVNRRDFYLANGFSDLDCRIKEGKVVYDVMSVSCSITPRDYDALMTEWLGKRLRKIVDVELKYLN